MSAIFFFDRFSRDTAATDESMAAVMFSNLLTQLDRVRLDEQNFLQRHNMKIIQQQLQVGQLYLTPHLRSKLQQTVQNPNAPYILSQITKRSSSSTELIYFTVWCDNIVFHEWHKQLWCSQTHSNIKEWTEEVTKPRWRWQQTERYDCTPETSASCSCWFVYFSN